MFDMLHVHVTYELERRTWFVQWWMTVIQLEITKGILEYSPPIVFSILSQLSGLLADVAQHLLNANWVWDSISRFIGKLRNGLLLHI